MNCNCLDPVVMRTSWTDNNPVRRFFTCPNSQGNGVGGCCCFEWIDPQICDRARQIIPGLLRRIHINEAEIELKKRSFKKSFKIIVLLVVLLVISWAFYLGKC